MHHRKPQSERLVYRRSLADRRIIQLAAVSCQQYHRKFQSFGFMNGHNAYRIVILANHLNLPHADLAFLDRVDVFHEAVQRAVLTVLIRKRFIDQRAQIRLSAAAGRHRAHGEIKPGFQKQLPDQLIQRQQRSKS